MPGNQIREIFTARIKQLIAQYEGSKAIAHAPTVGSMREGYLKDFIRELLPPKFTPVSGFICDMYGNITPQLDMIFFDNSELPSVSLISDTKIVPYETALMIAEVKSRITTDTLDQVKKQRTEILNMGKKGPKGSEGSDFLMGTSSPQTLQSRNRRQTLGTFIMAFESDVSEERLRQWVENEMGSPSGVCVVCPEKGTLSIFDQIISPLPRQIDIQKDSSFEPLLTFIGAIYRWLYYLQLTNSTASDKERDRLWNTHAMWIWEGYLSEFLYQHYQTFKQEESPNRKKPGRPRHPKRR